MALLEATIDIPTENWHGCYDKSWKGIINNESFSHPAKMAKGLVYRIVREGLERGWWKKGDLVADPFGGIGSTGIACSAYGIRSISIELESRFYRMANGYDCPGVTKQEWVRWHARKRQARNTGDRFCPFCLDLKYKKGSGIIPSQPEHHYVGNFELHRKDWTSMNMPIPVILQGDSRFLIDVIQQAHCVMTSPPFSPDGNQPIGNAPSTPVRSKLKALGMDSDSPYGTTEGNIAAMPIHGLFSPPYGNRVGNEDTAGSIKEGFNDIYGKTDGQMGNMRVNGMTSPPYEGTDLSYAKNGLQVEGRGKYERPYMQGEAGYGHGLGQIGQTTGNDYWGACTMVYSQLYQIMSPGGVMACVVKAFVKKKKLVDLPGQTLDLLQRIGFESVLWINAMLVSEATQGSMLEEVPTYTKQRKSFFRRLAERKGSPRIDAEIVLIVRKPGQREGESTCGVLSPPFMESTLTKPSAQVTEQLGSSMGRAHFQDGYGHTEGQIGAMKAGQ